MNNIYSIPFHSTAKFINYHVTAVLYYSVNTQYLRFVFDILNSGLIFHSLCLPLFSIKSAYPTSIRMNGVSSNSPDQLFSFLFFLYSFYRQFSFLLFQTFLFFTSLYSMSLPTTNFSIVSKLERCTTFIC